MSSKEDNGVEEKGRLLSISVEGKGKLRDVQFFFDGSTGKFSSLLFQEVPCRQPSHNESVDQSSEDEREEQIEDDAQVDKFSLEGIEKNIEGAKSEIKLEANECEDVYTRSNDTEKTPEQNNTNNVGVTTEENASLIIVVKSCQERCLSSTIPPESLLLQINESRLPLPSSLDALVKNQENLLDEHGDVSTNSAGKENEILSNSEALHVLENIGAHSSAFREADGIDHKTSKVSRLTLRFFVPPALDEKYGTSSKSFETLCNAPSAPNDAENFAEKGEAFSRPRTDTPISPPHNPSEGSLLDTLVNIQKNKDIGSDDSEDSDAQRDEDSENDLTWGLVKNVNKLLLSKLEEAELSDVVLAPDNRDDCMAGGESSQIIQVLPHSFICKYSSLYSWEVSRISHAFDKLAEKYIELLLSQKATDRARAADQTQTQVRDSEGRVVSSSENSIGDSENCFDGIDDEDEDDIIDHLPEDRDSLLQENLDKKNRFRFRNSVADTLFSLGRSDSSERSSGSEERSSGRDSSKSFSRSSSGIGLYEVTLHSRQLGMTIENVMERTVVRTVHKNSEASRLNVKSDSIILKIGANSTLSQTHLETLDTLRNSVRPVKLRLCTLSRPILEHHRSRMQSLVQRRKNLAIGACTTLNWIESRVLYVLELSAFIEGLSAMSLPPCSVPVSGEDSKTAADVKKEHEKRALKVLDKFKKAKYAFFENSRREALVNTRLQVLSEIMQDIYLLLDWPLAKKQAEENVLLSDGRSAVGLIAQSLRDICYTLLQLTNDQQVDLQMMFPDHHTCLVIDRLVQISLNPFMLRNHHIPSLWRLAGGHAPPARLACANLVPLIYLHLSTLQRLRIRGLLNRLLVDAVPAVRAYVLNSVCLRILHAVVSRSEVKQSPDDTDNADDAEKATLGWISHVMSQGSHDSHVDVRQSALLLCNRMIEYYSLGLKQKHGEGKGESQRLVSEIQSLLSDLPPSSQFSAAKSRPASESGDSDDDSTREDGKDSAEAAPWSSGHSSASLAYFNRDEGSGASSPELSTDKPLDERHSNLHFNFDKNLVVVPELSDVHIMFCRILPIVSRLVEDSAVSIRAAVVSMCGDFCVWMGGKWSAILLDIMVCCFRDSDDSVRAHALNAVPHAVLAHVLTAAAPDGSFNGDSIAKLFASLIPAVCTMRSDVSAVVRKSLCSTLSRVLAVLYVVSRDNASSTFQIIPKMLSQMCDVIVMLLEDKSPEVATEMLRELARGTCDDKASASSRYFSLLFSRQNSYALIRCMSFLSKPECNWRTRKLVCVLIPRLVSTTVSVEARTSIFDIVVPLLYDDVFEVRKAAARAFCESSVCDRQMSDISSGKGFTGAYNGEPQQDMGQMWLDCFVLPQLESLRTSVVFHHRILALHMIVLLILEKIVNTQDVRFNILFNIALTLVEDPVPNVRISLCKVMEVLLQNCCSRDENLESLIEAVDKLLKDEDTDVRYFAMKLKESASESTR